MYGSTLRTVIGSTLALWLMHSQPHAAEQVKTPIVMEDWTEAVGLADLEGPTYTAGWIDLDLDGDDEPFWVSSDALHYLNHDGDGKVVLLKATVETTSKYPFFVGPEGQAALVGGDFDRDGSLDLMVIQKVARLYTIAAPGVLVEKENVHLPYLPLGPASSDAAAGDFNGDGWPDVAIAQARTGTEHLYQRGAVDLILMNRGGHFERIAVEPALRKQSGSLAVADMDRDGRPDIVESVTFSRSSGLSRILLNRTEPGSAYPVFEVAEHTFDQGSMGMGVAIEDVNQDGFLDLFHASTGNDFLMFGHEDGTYTDETWNLRVNHEWTTEAGPRIQWAPTIVDMNADGLLDLYQRHGHFESAVDGGLLDATAQAHLVYAQRPDGTFERMDVPFDSDPAHNGTDAGMGDFDGDGLPELATGGIFGEMGAGTVGQPVFWYNASETNHTGRIITVHLQPTVSPNPPTGAWVRATCGDLALTRTLTTGGNVGALGTTHLFFAWPTCEDAVEVEIHWPTGAVSTETSEPGQTRIDPEEPLWAALGPAENGGLTVSLDPRKTTSVEACLREGPDATWTCCTEENAPCTYPYAPKGTEQGAVRIGDSGVELALQPLGGWQTLVTFPALPLPNEPVTVALLHGGIEASFGLGDPWIRLDQQKLALDTDEATRRRTKVVEGLPMGTNLSLTLFEGVKEQAVVEIPNGYAVDPRWLEEAVYPNRNTASQSPWRVYLTAKPHHPNEQLVKLNNISVRSHPGGLQLPALITRDQTGRLRIDVEWENIPAGQQVAVVEDDTLRAGPYPARPMPTLDDVAKYLDHAQGMFSRAVVVEDGDALRFIFTCYDADGNVMPPVFDLFQLTLDGLVQDGEFTVPTMFGNGWETSLILRSLPGVGPATLKLSHPNGKTLGEWTLMRRAAKDVPLSPEKTSVTIEQSTLPSGVGAKTMLRVMPKSSNGELMGRDANITVIGPPQIRVHPARVNESGLYESVVEPGFYGGDYSIEVFADGELLETVPFSVIGPAMPDNPPKTVHWPGDTEGEPTPTDAEPAPPSEPSGCNASKASVHAHGMVLWVYLAGLLGGIGWVRLRRRRRA